VLKLSHRLVLTGWRVLLNCNLVLNYTSSPMCFLRQKLQDGKSLRSLEISKRPLCIICQNGWSITRGTQLERRVLCLESRCYDKSYPGPKPITSPRFDECKPFSLFVVNSHLTPLSIACISFASSQMYSWVHVYHQAMLLWFHECLHVSYLVPQ
jgi:hypothetical protein